MSARRPILGELARAGLDFARMRRAELPCVCQHLRAVTDPLMLEEIAGGSVGYLRRVVEGLEHHPWCPHRPKE